MVIHKVKRLKV